MDTLRWAVSDPAKVFWMLVALALSVTLMGVGGIYLFRLPRGDSGWLRLHGGVMFLLALLNIWALASMSQAYNRKAWMLHRWTSMLTLFYASLTAVVNGFLDLSITMIFYGLATVLSLLLLVLSPPFAQDLHNEDLTTDSTYCA